MSITIFVANNVTDGLLSISVARLIPADKHDRLDTQLIIIRLQYVVRIGPTYI